MQSTARRSLAWRVPGCKTHSTARRSVYSALTDVPGIPRTIAGKIADKVNASRNQRISEILTAPDSVQQIVRMAKLSPDGLTAKYYAAALLGLDRAIDQ